MNEDRKHVTSGDEPTMAVGKPVSRRQFLKIAGLTGAAIGLGSGIGGLVAACGEEETTTTAASGATTTAVSASEATQELRIGIAEPLTGFPVGYSWVYGYELIFDKMNAQGGLQLGDTKYTFKTFVEDTKFTPDGAGTAAKKLIDQDKVHWIFGAILDLEAGAISDVSEPAGVLHGQWINMPGFKTDVSADKPLTIRPSISCDSAWIPDMEYLVKNWPNAKNMVVVVHDQGYEPWLETFYPIVEQYGVKHLGTVTIPIDATDFVPSYTKVLTYEPDVICAFASADAGDELNAARSLGYEGPLFSTSPLGAEVVLGAVQPSYAHDVFCNGANPFDPTPTMKELMDMWDAKYTEPFVSDAFMGWDSGWAVIQAAQKAQSPDPAKVVAAFESMSNEGDVQTCFGPGRIGGLQRFGVNRVLVRPIPMSSISNGEVVTEDYILAPPEWE